MFYSFMRVLAFIVLMPIFFIRVIGKANLKVEGGGVIIAHHTSNWDPIILGFIVKHKPVCYLAKEELFKGAAARFFLRKLNAISISRGKGDLSAIKTALTALKEGKLIGIFPEGKRSKDGSILPFGQGAALMALRAGVPVVPVYIKGGYKLFHQVKVFAGPPIYLDKVFEGKANSDTVKSATAYLQDKITEMSGQT